MSLTQKLIERFVEKRREEPFVETFSDHFHDELDAFHIYYEVARKVLSVYHNFTNLIGFTRIGPSVDLFQERKN